MLNIRQTIPGLIGCACLLLQYPAGAQQASPDTAVRLPVIKTAVAKPKLCMKQYILPASMIIYGAVNLKNEELADVNEEFREELFLEHPHRLMHIDNYLQFAPAAAVYTLRAAGVPSRNTGKNITAVYLLSNIMLGGTVYIVKKATHELRPDGSNYMSFPSGHTATAFAGAELLRHEYASVSPLYGVAGYTTAALIGCFRMYNNKHWFGDVVAGAGVGIITTKLSYWLVPKLSHALFPKRISFTEVL